MKLFVFMLILVYFICGIKYKFTIIHTNDNLFYVLDYFLLVHGYIDGHKESPELDLKFPDYYNFITHMKNNAEKNEIVLSFDSGDLVQGSGLSDATPIYGSFLFGCLKSFQ
jgi:2',3'-cyclic-nucleotide 2'-phosphodiesterase (5'-nucleotidase family)